MVSVISPGKADTHTGTARYRFPSWCSGHVEAARLIITETISSISFLLLPSSIPDPFYVPPSLLKAEQPPFLLFNSFHSSNPSPHDAYLSNHLSPFLSGLLHPYLCCSVSYSPEVGTEDGTTFHVHVKGKDEYNIIVYKALQRITNGF